MNEVPAPPSPAATTTPPSATRAGVFVSYSRKDIDFATMLVTELAVRGFNAFLDKTDIAPGEPWQERLAGLIMAADTVVFVVSPQSAASRICAWELEESARRCKRVIPIVARPVADGEAPTALGRLNYIFCTDADDRGAALAVLKQALDTDLPWVREHTRLGELAYRWEERGRARWACLRGVDLDVAERWLDRRPAEANAPSELHQSFIRASRRAATGRQRTWVAGASAVALVAVGLAVFAEMNRREAQTQRAAAEVAKTDAQRQRDAAEAQRRAAERNFAAAKQTVDGLIFDIAQGLRNVAGMRVETIRSILETVRRTVDKLSATAPQDRGLLRSRAAMMANFGDTFFAAGDKKAALAAYLDMMGILRALATRFPDDGQLQRDLSVSFNNIGVVKKAAGQLRDALAAYEDSLVILRKLALRSPGDVKMQGALADGLNNVARLKLQMGDKDGALAAVRESLAAARRFVAKAPDSREAMHTLIVSLERDGDVKLASGNWAGAIAAFQESLEHARAIAVREPDSTGAARQLAISLEKIGTAKLLTGNEAGAMADLRESLDVRRKLTLLDRDNVEFERDLAVSLRKFGDLTLHGLDAKHALPFYRESLVVRRRIAAIDGGSAVAERDVALSLEALGDALISDDRPAALLAYKESLDLRRIVVALSREDPHVQWDLVVMLVKIGAMSADPAPLYREALSICEALDRAGKLGNHRFALDDLRERLAALARKKADPATAARSPPGR